MKGRVKNKFTYLPRSLLIGKVTGGQSLIEMVVAIAVVVIVILALVAITTTSIRNAAFSRNQVLATKYAQGWIEEARGLRDSQPESSFFVDGSCTVPISAAGIFNRSRTCNLTTEIIDGQEKKTMTVVVTVSWTDAQGTHKSELTTRLTNWK